MTRYLKPEKYLIKANKPFFLSLKNYIIIVEVSKYYVVRQ